MPTYKMIPLDCDQRMEGNCKKSDWQEGCSLCVGLGGTGKDGIKRLKKEVYRRIKPDHPDASSSMYKNILFLIVDIDDSGIYRYSDECSKCWDIDTSTEYFDISDTDIFYYEQEIHSKKIPVTRPEFSWFNHEKFRYGYDVLGSGGVRQRGRLYLINKSNLLRLHLTRRIKDLINGFPGRLNVHIFSGLAGGTGSGSFIDVCYILQYVLESLGKSDALIHGHFFLPDMNLSQIAARKMDTPSLRERLEGNGYAALKELDYLINLEKYHDRFVQNYGQFMVNTNRAPVDICNLISATMDDGSIMENGYDYALNTVVDYVICNLTKDDGLIQKGDSQYSIIHFTHGEIPFSDIITYLSAKLFQQFDDIFHREPTLKDLSDFINNNQISLEQLTNQLTEGITHSIPYPKRVIKGTDIVPGDKRAVIEADMWIYGQWGTLEENRGVMIKKLANYDLSQITDSIISKIFVSLTDYAMDPKKGPFFVMRLLEKQGDESLIHFLDTSTHIIETRKSDELCREAMRKEELKTAEDSLAKANFINRQRRLKEYLKALENWYLHLLYINQYTIMKDLLCELQDQVSRLNEKFFQPMTALLDTLKNTFRENSSTLCEGKNRKNSRTWQIVELSQIQDQLNIILEDLDSEQEFQKLAELLLTHWRDWINGDEDAVTKLISQHIIQTFSSVSGKSMDHWLDSTSQSAGVVIQKHFDKAGAPPFWKVLQPGLENMEKRMYLLIPQNCPEIARAAEEVKPEGCQICCYNHIRHRITVVKMYCRVPLGAYQGLAGLESVYNADPAQAGRHLYETSDLDWRKTLPSPSLGAILTENS